MNSSNEQGLFDVKEKLTMLETECYKLHDWFGRYDQLIWKLRGLLFTIYAAVLVYSLHGEHPQGALFATLAIFALFFLTMELFWLYKYWAKRTRRYRLIQDVINANDPDRISRTPLLDMEMGFAKDKRASITNKIDEPLFFYLGLVAVAGVILLMGGR